MRFDLGVVKRVRISGRFTFEFRGELLNAFNNPYFNPASAGGTPLGVTSVFNNPGGPVAGNGTPINNPVGSTNVDNYRLTTLLGDNQSRIIQLVWRLRW